MGKKKRLNVCKLSASFYAAAQPVALGKLASLRRMITASTKIADQLSRLVEKT